MSTVSEQDTPVGQLSNESKIKLLTAAASTGCDRDIRIALMLTDTEPCPDCDYIRSGCRCPKDE